MDHQDYNILVNLVKETDFNGASLGLQDMKEVIDLADKTIKEKKSLTEIQLTQLRISLKSLKRTYALNDYKSMRED